MLGIQMVMSWAHPLESQAPAWEEILGVSSDLPLIPLTPQGVRF